MPNTLAFHWIQKSVKGGLTSAQFDLGNLYYYGQGVTENKTQAAYWIRKAYESGYKPAEIFMNEKKLWMY